MKAEFRSIRDLSTLDEVIARSHDEPVVIFKHSATCPISGAAYQRIGEVGRQIGLVVVQTARDISNEVESRTGVRHESPQAIVFRRGGAVWAASHWDITCEAVEQAVLEHA